MLKLRLIIVIKLFSGAYPEGGGGVLGVCNFPFEIHSNVAFLHDFFLKCIVTNLLRVSLEFMIIYIFILYLVYFSSKQLLFIHIEPIYELFPKDAPFSHLFPYMYPFCTEAVDELVPEGTILFYFILCILLCQNRIWGVTIEDTTCTLHLFLFYPITSCQRVEEGWANKKYPYSTNATFCKNGSEAGITF